MTKPAHFISCLLLLFFQIGHATETTRPSGSSAKSALFVKWGSAKDQVAYRTRSDKDPRVVFEVPLAVNSFWVDRDNSIYLLEAGRRLKVYRSGHFIRNLELEKHAGYINDFAVIGEVIYAVTSHRLLKISKDGSLLESTEVFGSIKSGVGVEKIFDANGLIVLMNSSIIVSAKEHADFLHSCFDSSSLKKAQCPRDIDLPLDKRQVVDIAESYYAWNDFDSRRLVISSLDGQVNIRSDIDVFSLSQRIDFLINSLVRVRGDYVFYISPERTGLRILKEKFR